MNILTKSMLLTSLLFLGGCAHHSRHYAGHAAYGVSIETHVPYRSSNFYHDDAYIYTPSQHYNHNNSHHYERGHDYHDRSNHYEHKKHYSKKPAKMWRKKRGRGSRHRE